MSWPPLRYARPVDDPRRSPYARSSLASLADYTALVPFYPGVGIAVIDLQNIGSVQRAQSARVLSESEHVCKRGFGH
jgi:hypothetical protein